MKIEEAKPIVPVERTSEEPQAFATFEKLQTVHGEQSDQRRSLAQWKIVDDEAAFFGTFKPFSASGLETISTVSVPLMQRITTDFSKRGQRPLQSTEIDWNQRTVLVFPGIGLGLAPESQAASYLCAVESLLDASAGNPQLLVFQHPACALPKSIDWGPINQMAEIYAADPNHTFSTSAITFARAIFLPMLAESSEANSWQRNPLAKVKERFLKLVIFSHSYGGPYAEQVGNALAMLMEQLAFAPEEIQEACGTIRALSIANVAPVPRSKNLFNTVYMQGANDTGAQGLMGTHPKTVQATPADIEVSILPADSQVVRILMPLEIPIVRQGAAKTREYLFSDPTAHAIDLFVNRWTQGPIEPSGSAFAIARTLLNNMLRGERAPRIDGMFANNAE